jgi:polysaccharide biosynthesis protein PslH
MSLISSQDRLKILFITSHWPLAPAYGAQQRVLNLARLLNRFGDVSFVIVPTEREDEQTRIETNRYFKVHGVIRPSVVSPDHRTRWSERVRHECDPAYLATDECIVSEQDRAWLQQLAEQHDVVWFHTIRTANWFRTFRWPHSVLDVDDLPSSQHASEAHLAASVSMRLIGLRRYWIWRRRERTFKDRFDVLTVCSENDRRLLNVPARVHVIPNGAPMLESRRRLAPNLKRIGFLGNCTFKPNSEGMHWFIRYAWPVVKRAIPDAQLRVVGRGSEDLVSTLGPDIQGLGWLEDPGAEIDTWSAMIVPIRTGAGTRVKVAEGFSRRCPVVSTSLGVFGYEVEDGTEILLADQAQDFARACIRLLKNPELQTMLSERAFDRFLTHWTWSSFANTVGEVVRQAVTQNSRKNFDAELAEVRNR